MIRPKECYRCKRKVESHTLDGRELCPECRATPYVAPEPPPEAASAPPRPEDDSSASLLGIAIAIAISQQ